MEDELLALWVFEQQAQLLAGAVRSASTAADVSLNEFNAGTVAYTTVIASIQNLIADEQSALATQQNRLVATVSLVAALGGGWDTSAL